MKRWITCLMGLATAVLAAGNARSEAIPVITPHDGVVVISAAVLVPVTAAPGD